MHYGYKIIGRNYAFCTHPTLRIAYRGNTTFALLVSGRRLPLYLRESAFHALFLFDGTLLILDIKTRLLRHPKKTRKNLKNGIEFQWQWLLLLPLVPPNNAFFLQGMHHSVHIANTRGCLTSSPAIPLGNIRSREHLAEQGANIVVIGQWNFKQSQLVFFLFALDIAGTLLGGKLGTIRIFFHLICLCRSNKLRRTHRAFLSSIR